MGAIPSWYADLKIAQYLGCAPWELWDHPEWASRADVALKAENGAKRATAERTPK